ncbi:MAG: hypothetical protein JWN25_1452 [Verrucomicrobiales bacterium]|nr:hypothetical protein [Verrucomicrobiales bacterium]
MNAHTILAALLLAAFTGAVHAATEDHIDKRFKVAAAGKLTIKADRGDIDVTTGNEKEIHVEIIRAVKRGSDDQANRLLDSHQITFTPSGNNLSIEAQTPSSAKSIWSFNEPQLQVHYIVTIPKQFEVDFSTAGGNLKLGDLEGNARLRTAGGNISVGNIVGQVDAKTSGGNIQVNTAKGNVKIETAGGDLKVASVEGDLTGKTSGGNIKIGEVSGSTEVTTAGGNISLDALGGTTSARTSGGNITAHFTHTPKSDCVLKTSGGDIKVTLPEAAALNIDAQTSGGEVRTEFAEIKKGSSHLKTQINGGGSELVLKTSAGNIKIGKSKS